MKTPEKPDDMQELITQIARALVDLPSEVIVQEVNREGGTVLRLQVAPSDVGKVIGKQGRTARSMRTILAAVSMKHHHRYTLEVLEESIHTPPSNGAGAALRRDAEPLLR